MNNANTQLYVSFLIVHLLDYIVSLLKSCLVIFLFQLYERLKISKRMQLIYNIYYSKVKIKVPSSKTILIIKAVIAVLVVELGHR